MFWHLRRELQRKTMIPDLPNHSRMSIRLYLRIKAFQEKEIPSLIVGCADYTSRCTVGKERASDQMFALGALTYKVSRRLQLDAGVRFGLNQSAPRVGVFAGVTVGVADLYKRN